MKRLIVFLLFLGMGFYVSSQTTKGKFLLGGSTGLQFTSSTLKYTYDGESDGSSKSTTLSLIPNFAYFLADDIALGLTSTIQFSSDKSEAGTKINGTSMMLFPTAIYYFKSKGAVKPLVQIAAGLVSSSEKYIPRTGNSESVNVSGYGYNAGVGLAYFVKENISINFGLSYTFTRLPDPDDSDYVTKQGSIASNIGIAIYF